MLQGRAGRRRRSVFAGFSKCTKCRLLIRHLAALFFTKNLGVCLARSLGTGRWWVVRGISRKQVSGVVVIMGVAWRHGTWMLVERDFLGRVHLQRRPRPFPLSSLLHSPTLQVCSWSPAGSLVSARQAALSPQGLFLLPHPSL